MQNEMHPDREVNPAAAARQFADCRKIGLGQARVAVEWATIEPRRGQFDFSTMDRTLELAEANGVELLEVIEPTFRVALRRPQVQRVSYYALRDNGESFWLFRSDGTPKPAAARLRELCRGAR